MNITHSRLAEAIGVDPSRIHSIVHGQRSITAETALLLSRFLASPPVPDWSAASVLSGNGTTIILPARSPRRRIRVLVEDSPVFKAVTMNRITSADRASPPKIEPASMSIDCMPSLQSLQPTANASAARQPARCQSAKKTNSSNGKQDFSIPKQAARSCSLQYSFLSPLPNRRPNVDRLRSRRSRIDQCHDDRYSKLDHQHQGCRY